MWPRGHSGGLGSKREPSTHLSGEYGTAKAWAEGQAGEPEMVPSKHQGQSSRQRITEKGL